MTRQFSLLAFAVTTLLMFGIATANCPVTKLPPEWSSIKVPGSNYCYVIGISKTNPEAARTECWTVFRGFLAQCHDVTSLRSLAKKIRINTNKVWIDLIKKSNAEWMWSDGKPVDSSFLEEALGGKEVRAENGAICGALANGASPKFSKWTSERCNANHEFICQAPKLDMDSDICTNGTLQINDKCYSVSSEPLSFLSAMNYCKEFHSGHLAALENKELLVTTANYFKYKRQELKNVRVWLDVVWSEGNKRWEHLDGRKVSFYEENWSTPSQKAFAISKSSVVIDQNMSWNWKAQDPNSKAYAVCEVGSVKTIEGKAVGPEPGSDNILQQHNATSRAALDETTTTISTTSKETSFVLDVKTLGIIAAAVGAVFCILLIVICLLCCKKKNCCMTKEEVYIHSDGFGTPVSFNFMNGNYEDVSLGNTPQTRPLVDPPNRELPHPPLEGDETYATINDHPISPPISTVDLLHAPPNFSSLSLTRSRISRESDLREASTFSLPRTHYSSRISVNDSQGSIGSYDPVPTPMRRQQMASFAPSDRTSPYYAPMRNQQESSSDTPPLQYAELAFGEQDEDDQFHIGRSSYLGTRESTDHENNNAPATAVGAKSPECHRSKEDINPGCNHANNRNLDQRFGNSIDLDRSHGNGGIARSFNGSYPDLLRPGASSNYGNEHFSFISTPDSPQFPFRD